MLRPVLRVELTFEAFEPLAKAHGVREAFGALTTIRRVGDEQKLRRVVVISTSTTVIGWRPA